MNDCANTYPAVERFVEVVRRYCAWVESSPAGPHEDMVTARQLFTELHLAVISLPKVDLGDDESEDEGYESRPASLDGWKQARERFSHLPVEGYWDVFEPLKEDQKEPVCCSLSDDIADVYRDIKEYLPLFDKGQVEEAVWQWRFSFLIHWGQHLTGAQRALHAYFVNREEEDWLSSN